MFDKPEFLYYYKGKTYTAKRLAEDTGIDKKMFLTRMRRGDFTVEEAVLWGQRKVVHVSKEEED